MQMMRSGPDDLRLAASPHHAITQAAPYAARRRRLQKFNPASGPSKLSALPATAGEGTAASVPSLMKLYVTAKPATKPGSPGPGVYTAPLTPSGPTSRIVRTLA